MIKAEKAVAMTLASIIALSGCTGPDMGATSAVTTSTISYDLAGTSRARCTQIGCNDGNTPQTLDMRAKKALQLMREHGVGPTSHEDATFVLHWVRSSIPADAPPMPCVDIFATYDMFRRMGTCAGHKIQMVPGGNALVPVAIAAVADVDG